MSSNEKSVSKRLRKNKDKNTITEDYLVDFCKKYTVTYTSNIEELAINLALKGQESLANDEIELAEEISDLLSRLSDQWKDGFIKMKSHLLRAEITGYKYENKIPHLEKALSFAKKNNILDVEAGVRIQLAFEKFKERDYKRVLKELKIVEKKSDFFENNKLVVLELKARVYWDLDDFTKGFDATYDWYKMLKTNSTDLHSLFVSVVYLLTVMSSIKLHHSKEELDEIKEEITKLLVELATSVHLLTQILPYIDVLFAKSLQLVEPEILHNFTDHILQTARWNDEEKYLYICQKIADAYYNIDDIEKAIELMDKSYQYTREKKYTKVEKSIQYKKVEFSSLIFYFMNFDALFDPGMIKNLKIKNNGDTEKLFLEPLSSGVNTFPATSYSQLLKILEKASDKYIIENSLELTGLNPEEERCFFVLDLDIAGDRIRILMREDFSIDTKEFKTLHSTLTPYYSVIGLISDNKTDAIAEIEGIEEVLLRLQRAINCPASKATIYLPKGKPHLNLFKFYLQQGGFRDLKVKIIDTAKTLGREYEFAKHEDFLQIFNADPITIFDLTLRSSQQLEPLTKLINHAYNLNVSNSTLSEFLAKLMESFLKRSDTRFWRDFYYEYAWLQIQGVYLSLSNNEVEEKKKLIEKILSFALLLEDSDKILEGHYFSAYLGLIQKDNNFKQKNLLLKEKSNSYSSSKYKLISHILEQFEETIDFTDNEKLAELLNSFCELCEYRDWDISLELFIYLLSKLPQLTTLFEVCKERDIKDTGIYLYLHLSKHMIDIERYSEAVQLLMFIQHTLIDRKEDFFFSDHTWDYLYFTANQHLYAILDSLTSEEIEEHQLEKETILSSILERDEWVSDPIYLVELLKDYTMILLDKTDYSMGEKYYHWIEQLMFYSWDLFTSETNSSLLQEIQDLKKRIESQHFI
ncbi:MAG: hypothetical protein GOP50_09155 [Candidatus Heimdallarchaeota archaeon]|nr:hypothetical protein [Candidatus Heimdallarchaeota archaeon]